MPASTAGVFENWISEYWTTWTRLPQGSLEVQPVAGLDVDARLAEGLPNRGAVVHHQPEVAVPVRRAGLAVRQGEELVAHVEERHARHPAAQLELEDAAVELDRFVDVADGQHDVVDADQSAAMAEA